MIYKYQPKEQSQRIVNFDSLLASSEGVSDLRSPISNSSNTAEIRPIKSGIFSNRSDLFTSLSHVSMHLKSEMIERVRSQLSELLDPNDFNPDEDVLIRTESFAYFLSFLLRDSLVRLPMLTVSYAGNISASWINESGRLHIEFLNNGLYRTTASRQISKPFEYLAHQGTWASALAYIKTNGMTTWYQDGR